ncbi:Putative amidotransferase similar to cobyric acid synthase [Pediococcus damnosus]|uniref:Lipid II isoglutaminyl synthase (glutamine-hydrolyzing) subunit GatD n=1 Tax=Pediococcus damnosus TaxID=51663 RepID=A0A0R2HFQ9_9LACO|nr:glutamine amidotransferase [Pediococcus damnosus]AMV59932.1 Putative amidotransferase similar to cobyric acid synthase [Pediococcus damnosus]AMV62483.1 Putative amidotransferase similar to cobyric acid synthase [Pediococcus damnosus]AMV64176.1 Putative amidotransferase similar to cobyric acid synthase [Pediococcus damnosus]AMV67652.1 Putative amidotransferase similar to cobyric acid synthase [Pediococcus damnosus]AMV69021.1 Putative amidotransferase similar to cobyric acid synthase [Pedioco
MNYSLNVAHLYGNLLNTYGDNGNLLALKYYAKQMNTDLNIKVISLDDEFKADNFDLVFFGGGQDYEQLIVSKDIASKKDELTKYIDDGGPLLAICGGYQLLGHYYIGANGEKIPGIGALDHYTLSQDNNRFIGNILIKNKRTHEEYHGFENHNGMTFLGKGEEPLGIVESGHGNNGQDKTEGVIYKNVYGSYFHGPILTRNGSLAKHLLITALERKYPQADLTQQRALKISETF